MNFEKLTNSFWTLQIIGWLVYAFLIFITFAAIAEDGNYLGILKSKSFRAFVGFALTLILWQIYRRAIKRLSMGQIVLIVLVSSVFFGAVWSIIYSSYHLIGSTEFDLGSEIAKFPRSVLDFAVTLMAWSAIYFGIKYRQQSQMERENAIQAMVLAEKAQLEMLRYQLNPHFLFNALNSIRASVDEDKKRAKNMITQLSEFLRHSLVSGEAKEMPLSDELEAVRNYLAIEKIRFEEKLEVTMNVDALANDFKVPCFILNPLIENAVKHGMQTSPKPLKITVSTKLDEKELLIEVKNTGKLDDAYDSNGTKIGLKNVRERLEKLYPEKSSFELKESGGVVSAKIKIKK